MLPPEQVFKKNSWVIFASRRLGFWMLMVKVPLYLTLNNIDVEIDNRREIKLVDFKGTV